MKKRNENQRNEMYKAGLLFCSYCSLFLPYRDFHKNGQGNYGYSFKCKECRKKYERDRGYHFNTVERIKSGYRNRKKIMIELLGGKCQVCGFHDGIFALEFHHVFQIQKSAALSDYLAYKNIDRTRQEVDKCALLCSNCHKTFTKTWMCDFVKLECGYGVANVVRIGH